MLLNTRTVTSPEANILNEILVDGLNGLGKFWATSNASGLNASVSTPVGSKLNDHIPVEILYVENICEGLFLFIIEIFAESTGAPVLLSVI